MGKVETHFTYDKPAREVCPRDTNVNRFHDYGNDTLTDIVN